MKPKTPRFKEIRPRFRVLLNGEIALGPGKAALLAQVAAAGSISRAAEELGMSYMRAWTIIKTMNRCFKKPLVVPVRGGAKGGGAQLTAAGKKALALYELAQAESLRATAATWEEVLKMLRD